MSNKQMFLWLGVFVLGLGIVALFNQNPSVKQLKFSSLSTSPTVVGATPSPDKLNNTISLTKNGFEPKMMQVKKNETITFINTSGSLGNVSSDNHPTHLLFPKLNLGNFNDGQMMKVSFDKSGTYTYHNHTKPAEKGTIVVSD